MKTFLGNLLLIGLLLISFLAISAGGESTTPPFEKKTKKAEWYDDDGNIDVQKYQEAMVLKPIEGTTGGGADKSAWKVFLLGFAGGLFALLTPCVFPMIPLTVSFFTKGSEQKGKGIFNAIMYGFFIFLIYVGVSAPFHLFNLAPDVLNEVATNVWLNLAFFAIFMVFAFSFFGYYEIQMPSSLTNKMSQAENVGGIVGVFFMAVTLALVSFSCTGPIVGSLLAGTLTQGAWILTAGMAGFGVALGLPFALFAMFPKMMSSLPTSGGWLNSVKVVLGFLEIALAMKFISNADLVDPSTVLIKREIFFAVWVLVGAGIVVYLLGWIKFPHDSPVTKRSKARWAFILFFGVSTALMIPSLGGSDLTVTRKVLSGFPPPMQFSFFYKESDVKTDVTEEDRKNYYFAEESPYDIPAFHDLHDALAYAEDKNKPMLIDFTGWNCVNCRRMEENVWPEEGIIDLLSNDLVLVSLYVDEKKELPEDQQIEFEYDGYTKTFKTVGNKWSTLEIINYGASTQPWYVIISPELDILSDPIGYTPDAKQYKQWIVDGLDKWEEIKLTETVSNN